MILPNIFITMLSSFAFVYGNCRKPKLKRKAISNVLTEIVIKYFLINAVKI